MESIVIDNCVVSKFMGNGIRITPISLAKKMNPSLNIDLLQKKHTEVEKMIIQYYHN